MKNYEDNLINKIKGNTMRRCIISYIPAHFCFGLRQGRKYLEVFQLRAEPFD